MLDDVASSYQAFLIDSGALYIDLRDENSLEANASRVDYTRHMMASDDFTSQMQEAGAQSCSEDALTPSWRCNSFAALGNALLPWQKGISQEDTLRAVRIADKDGAQQAVVFRLVEKHDGAELRLLATAEASEQSDLVDCIAAAIIAAVGPMLLEGMPRLEVAVSLRNEAVSRRMSTLWSPPYGRREDVPPPLFSFCSEQKDFWDIPLPSSLCHAFRPTCKNAKVMQLQAEEEQCYIFRLLRAYAELLRYRPLGHAMEEQALTMDDLIMASGAAVLKSWPVELNPSAQDLMSQCDMLVARAAA
ncbi:unnamed protein product [Symbiodinium natans]|uniref:Uncharacterized protein n=1 Tax=Symbiodinium natans TaxID=878477 RepID=A0A812T7D7_9DINO|nr:unnamed protein product [Symbiodinium natans]